MYEDKQQLQRERIIDLWFEEGKSVSEIAAQIDRIPDGNPDRNYYINQLLNNPHVSSEEKQLIKKRFNQ